MMITPQTDIAVAQALLAQKAEIDRLRDLVRKLANEWEQMEERDTVCNTDRVKRMYALFREALGEALFREVLGEDTP